MGALNRPDIPAQRALTRAGYTILTDFDGTITLADTTEALFARFADPMWVDLEAAWARGEITTEHQLCASYQTITASRDEIDHFLDQMRIDIHFGAFVDLCRDEQWPLSVLSDGLDYHITRILARYGLAHLPIVANHMEYQGTTRRFSFPRMCVYTCPQGKRSAGICKRSLVAREQDAARMRHPRQTVFIGDGVSDRCAVDTADWVFAKGKLAAYCRQRAIQYTPFATFADIIAALTSGLPSPPEEHLDLSRRLESGSAANWRLSAPSREEYRWTRTLS